MLNHYFFDRLKYSSKIQRTTTQFPSNQGWIAKLSSSSVDIAQTAAFIKVQTTGNIVFLTSVYPTPEYVVGILDQSGNITYVKYDNSSSNGGNTSYCQLYRGTDDIDFLTGYNYYTRNMTNSLSVYQQTSNDYFNGKDSFGNSYRVFPVNINNVNKIGVEKRNSSGTIIYANAYGRQYNEAIIQVILIGENVYIYSSSCDQPSCVSGKFVISEINQIGNISTSYGNSTGGYILYPNRSGNALIVGYNGGSSTSYLFNFNIIPGTAAYNKSVSGSSIIFLATDSSGNTYFAYSRPNFAWDIVKLNASGTTIWYRSLNMPSGYVIRQGDCTDTHLILIITSYYDTRAFYIIKYPSTGSATGMFGDITITSPLDGMPNLGSSMYSSFTTTFQYSTTPITAPNITNNTIIQPTNAPVTNIISSVQ